MVATVERHEFQAEAKQLLDLMIHSIYSNKDIFLRELISNSSDAIDKFLFESLTRQELKADDYQPQILIERDPAANTLTIQDNGIGMNREDLKSLIGTIAKSGTREFAKILKEKQASDSQVPPELIGQFGVGFYSVFMVADKVTLITRKAGEDQATRWESSGDGAYTLEDAEYSGHGTTITLHLKTEDSEDGLYDYTNEWKLREIIKKYSDFVAHPIQMEVERKEGETTRTELETLNSQKAIWTRPESEVSEEEYNEFYKHISHDWHNPLMRFGMKMEGTFEARALLFVPSQAPADLYYREGRRGIQLYVKRVFIMDDCRELMPDYLRFIKGVVDSEDLSLNISREILQQDRQIRAIRKRLVKKVLSELESLKEKEYDKYLSFWGEFGKAMKEGLIEDFENREAISKLALFQSTHSDSALTTLTDYVSRMKPEQQHIYYMTGESRQTIENSPHLEAFQEKGYEVLLLTDAVDEIWVQQLGTFEGKPLHSVGKGNVELGTEEERQEAEKARKEKETEYRSLLGCLEGRLGEYVKEVRFSSRLTNSASCLVGNEGDMTPQMEQLLRAMNQEVPTSKRILELNPNHPLIEKLQGVYQANPSDDSLSDFAYLLYGQALLAEGSTLPEPGRFSKLIANLMVKSI